MTGILIVNKPPDWTSHDVVARLRGLLKEKRVGHGGTLDPMATGVLPVFLGRATRAVQFCEDFDKEYVAGLRLGTVTDTQDTTGNVLATSEVTATRSDVEAVLQRFTGVLEQIPPMYSAVKIGGKKLYELARRGIEMAREPRRVTIGSIELLDMSGHDIILRVTCSKGTYIRTLCHDIGYALGCGGTMFSLDRTRVGPFSLPDALALSDIEAGAASAKMSDMLRPVDSLFADFPAIAIDAGRREKCLVGADFSAAGAAGKTADGTYRVYDEHGSFLMLGRAEGGVMRTVKSFFEI